MRENRTMWKEADCQPHDSGKKKRTLFFILSDDFIFSGSKEMSKWEKREREREGPGVRNALGADGVVSFPAASPAAAAGITLWKRRRCRQRCFASSSVIFFFDPSPPSSPPSSSSGCSFEWMAGRPLRSSLPARFRCVLVGADLPTAPLLCFRDGRNTPYWCPFPYGTPLGAGQIN